MANSASAYDLDSAITAYKSRMIVPTLKGGTLITSTFKTNAGNRVVPTVRAGGFARVYRFIDTSHVTRAVRCFYKMPAANAQQRYSRIDQYFRSQVADITAEFRFHQRGIWIKPDSAGPMFEMPIIEMEWVDGELLRHYIERLIANNSLAELATLPDRWLNLTRRMRAARMAHGDLSSDNIMVRKNKSLVLIDYDGVFLPVLGDLPEVQVGNRDYQHPQAANRGYDEKMDYFSTLLIYVALLAIVERPALWRKYGVYENGKLASETILFDRLALANPYGSALFRELQTIPNGEFQQKLADLISALRGPVAQVPDLLALVEKPTELFRQLLQAIQQSNNAEIVRLAETQALQSFGPANVPSVKQAVNEARQRISGSYIEQGLERLLGSGSPSGSPAQVPPIKQRAQANPIEVELERLMRGQ